MRPSKIGSDQYQIALECSQNNTAEHSLHLPNALNDSGGSSEIEKRTPKLTSKQKGLHSLRKLLPLKTFKWIWLRSSQGFYSILGPARMLSAYYINFSSHKAQFFVDWELNEAVNDRCMSIRYWNASSFALLKQAHSDLVYSIHFGRVDVPALCTKEVLCTSTSNILYNTYRVFFPLQTQRDCCKALLLYLPK